MLTEREIKLRYRDLAMKFHPDKQIFDDDTWIKKINNAKDFLIKNLDQVNQFLCRTNPQILREEAIRKEEAKQAEEKARKAREEAERKQQAKAEEERRKRAEEERRRYDEQLRAERAKKQAEEQARKAEEFRRKVEEQVRFKKWYESLSPKEKKKYDKEQAKKAKQEKKKEFLRKHPHYQSGLRTAIVLLTLAVVIAFILIWRFSIYPIKYYKSGMDFYEKEEYSLAIEQFEKAGKYKHSKDYLKRSQGEMLILDGKPHEAGLLFGSIENNEDYQRSKELVWNDYVISQTIAMSSDYMVAITDSGSLIGKELNSKYHSYNDFSSWEDITYLAMTEDTIVGLRSDGTVVAEGNSKIKKKVKKWKNIVQIYATSDIVYALKADGSIVHTSSRKNNVLKEIKEWNNIVNFDIVERTYLPYDSDNVKYYYYAVGVKVDGTVQYLGDDDGYAELSTWEDIQMVSLAYGDWIGLHIVGLKKDNTVVACGTNHSGVCNVSSWNNIIQVHTLSTYTFGLKKDGTIILVGSDAFSRKDVSNIINGAYMPKIGNLLVVDKYGDLQCEKGQVLAMAEWKNIAVPQNPF
ncbi:MAG: hypothetical protein K2H02_01030, partial [Anaeroplasmataceae bacterium]|nr:hypothetical protein [Anaeroplasmataceae bacterium]